MSSRMSAIANYASSRGSLRPFFEVGRLFARVTPILVAGIVVVVLFLGWLASEEEYLTPKSGLGYWLGIYGGVTMLLLLIYSIRKRLKRARWLGPIPLWFRLHMIFGITGPVLIMFHANFKLGSLNSNVAFFTMLTVAGSGIVGRYFYGKIYLGLYGRKAEVEEILAEAELLRQSLGHELEAANYIARRTKLIQPARDGKSADWPVFQLVVGRGAFGADACLTRAAAPPNAASR